MKGILSGRLLKGAVHTNGVKRFSKSLYNHRRLHKRLRFGLLKSKPLAGYLNLEKRSSGELKSTLSVSKEAKYEDANINEECKRGETKGEYSLNSQGTKGVLTIENSQPTKDEDISKGPIITSEWRTAAQSIVATSEDSRSAPIVFICGGKNAGKSTFARYLVNTLLQRYNKVGFLDTDVGQPELTPPGCLSLHILDKPILGVSALEMKNPERCYFYGDVSPKGNPDYYLQNIFALYDYFRAKYYMDGVGDKTRVQDGMHMPLVINTHGWIQGVGFDVLAEILRYVVPSHVVQILLMTSSRNLPRDRFWDTQNNDPCNTKILHINSAVGGSNNLAEIKFNARELRELRVMSYFQNGLKDISMQTNKLPYLYTEAAIALASCKPYQVPILAIKVMHLHYQVPSSESLYALNARLIGLGVSSSSGNCGKLAENMQPSCVGLGIIRGIDTKKGLFYVISPLSLEKLQQVDTFLHGKVEIPIPLLKAPGYVSPYLCCNSISIEGTGSAVMGSGKKKYLRSSKPAI